MAVINCTTSAQARTKPFIATATAKDYSPYHNHNHSQVKTTYVYICVIFKFFSINQILCQQQKCDNTPKIATLNSICHTQNNQETPNIPTKTKINNLQQGKKKRMVKKVKNNTMRNST